jgi:predicted Zn-dependent protease/predicted Ser/Thr protein kinase
MTKGQRISHYVIDRLLGKGGMGEVYLAHDTILDRDVAIKFLPDAIQHDSGARERFLREAKSAAALDHPFICQIYETGAEGGKSFIVMEYVEGCTLSKKLEAGPYPVKEALLTACEIAEALDVAHAKGIVHRDLKPANIMCTPQGHVKVMDFGLAKRFFPGGESISATITQSLTPEAMTRAGQIVGTIDHMSPEQAKGEAVDPRSDVFSLGVILYELVVGKNPFERPSPVETLSALLRDPVPALSIKPKNAGPILQNIIKKCLAKKAGERYRNVADLAADLRNLRERVVAGLAWKKWAAFAAAGAVVVIAAVAVWRFVIAPKAGPPPAEREPITVLVADFENRTGDASLEGGGIEQALVLGLEQAPFINIYRRQDARQVAGNLVPKDKGKLTAAQGQLVCMREGIQVLIDGRIETGKGGSYSLTVGVTDAANGKTLARPSRNVPQKAELMGASAKLAGPIIKEFGGNAAEAAFKKSIETFSTGSLEAMNAYAGAQELMKKAKRSEAISEYERAIQADPGFGRAYSGLAVAYHNRRDFQKAEKFHQEALARLDSMNEREKWRTRGVWYLMTKNFPKAIEEFSALIKQFPADSAGRSNLAMAYFYARDMAKAVEQGGAYVRIYPSNFNGQYNLSCYSIGAGDFVLGLEQAKKTIELNANLEKAYVTAALAELAQERNAEAEAWYAKLEPINTTAASFAAYGTADVALYEGRLKDAVKILAGGLAADITDAMSDMAAAKQVLLASSKLRTGQKDAAVQAAEKSLAMSRNVEIIVPAAEVFLEAGREDKAEILIRELGERLEPDPRAYAKILQGHVAKKKGRMSDAIDAYAEAQKIVDTWLGRLALGKAYLEAGKFAEAHSELDACFKRRGEAASVFQDDLPTWRYVPEIYYYLGRSQEGLKSPAAKESYKKFLTIKAQDEGDPMIAEARRRLHLL